MSSIRTVLIWLLMLALPAQAVTAATMAFCGPGHHGRSTTLAAPTGDHGRHAAAGAHGHATAVAHADHGHTTDHRAADDTTIADGAAQPDTPASAHGHGDQKKCSACASCCSVAVIHNVALAVPLPDFGATLFCALVPSVGAYATGGPDRPPRTPLS